VKINDFLDLVTEALEHDGVIDIDDRIDEIDEWDSLGALSIVAMLDGMSVSVDLEMLEKMETVRDLAEIAGVVDGLR
jgi:acyl carrier protein